MNLLKNLKKKLKKKKKKEPKKRSSNSKKEEEEEEEVEIKTKDKKKASSSKTTSTPDKEITLSEIEEKIRSLGNKKKKVTQMSSYFKLGKGQYGEGDIFLGITNPLVRGVCKDVWQSTSLETASKLLESKFHEERFLALTILIEIFKKSNSDKKKEIFDLYISKIQFINNWDLVDCSAPHIVGKYLLDEKKMKELDLLYTLAKKDHLWSRRISMIACLTFIKDEKFDTAVDIATILLQDAHDLIHKAVGWMLREIGKKHKKTLTDFLDKHHKTMPRTALRYSLEKLNSKEKAHYMAKEKPAKE